jgi:hypothetical protein
MQKFSYHGVDAGSLIEVLAKDDCAWLSLNSFVHPGHVPDAPQIDVHFERGMAGRRQLLQLIEQLELAASVLLAHREQADMLEIHFLHKPDGGPIVPPADR